MNWIHAHAKAVVPAAATLTGVITLYAITGELNKDELYAAVVGLLVAAGVYRIPNKEGT